VEGQNVIFESRWGEGWGEGQVGRTRRLADELVEAKVDILVTAGTEALSAAKEATRSIPIVTATGGDLVAMGLAASLARPGGNVTGVISLINQLTEKRLELIKQLVPRASRVAVLGILTIVPPRSPSAVPREWRSPWGSWCRRSPYEGQENSRPPSRR
jgi:putative tryptophan/tyrosine transport system substrate-binding protein